LLVVAIPSHTLEPFHFLELINSLITMYKHNRRQGNTSRNQSHSTEYLWSSGWLASWRQWRRRQRHKICFAQ
jgi:hypothetical protein